MGEIDYDHQARLYPGRERMQVKMLDIQLILVDKSKEEGADKDDLLEELEELNAIALECLV